MKRLCLSIQLFNRLLKERNDSKKSKQQHTDGGAKKMKAVVSPGGGSNLLLAEARRFGFQRLQQVAAAREIGDDVVRPVFCQWWQNISTLLGNILQTTLVSGE